MDQAPILPTAGPLLGDVHGCKVEHFKQAVVAGEHRFAFGNLPKLAVKSFDGISGINELPYLARMLGGCGRFLPSVIPIIYLFNSAICLLLEIRPL